MHLDDPQVPEPYNPKPWMRACQFLRLDGKAFVERCALAHAHPVCFKLVTSEAEIPKP